MRGPQLTWGQTDGIMAAITWSPSQGLELERLEGRSASEDWRCHLETPRPRNAVTLWLQ